MAEQNAPAEVQGIAEQNSPTPDMPTISKPKKLTVDELLNLMKNTTRFAYIYGKLYVYNGAYYTEYEKRQLEELIVGRIRMSPFISASMRTIKECAEMLSLEPWVRTVPEEDNGVLLFHNGYLAWKDWLAYGCEDFSKMYFTYRIDSTVPLREYLPVNLPTPRMDYFLAHIANNNAQIIERIWEMIGYLLVPDMNGKAFFLLQGKSNTGKSILGRLISALFEEGSQKVRNMSLDQLAARSATSNLMHVCLSISMDLPDQVLSPLAIRNIKLMTGNDDMEVEYRPGVYGKYQGTCKFLFGTNHTLVMQAEDDGFTNRIVCIPFYNVVSRERMDMDLLEGLLNERNCIVAKALDKYHLLRERKYVFSGSDLDICQPRIRYLKRASDDKDEGIRKFVTECCVISEDVTAVRCYTYKLYSAYTRFCMEGGYKPIGTEKSFSACLFKNYGDVIEDGRWREGEENKNGFYGITLKSLIKHQ